MNFLFNDSSTQYEQNLSLQPLSLCRELGKGCARFPVHRGYRHYLRPNILRRVPPLLPILANSCFPYASYNRLQVFKHSFFFMSVLRVGVLEQTKHIFFKTCDRNPLIVVLFHCKCLGFYLVSSYLSFVELLNPQLASIIQNLKR